jgi:hypothetical protein
MSSSVSLRLVSLVVVLAGAQPARAAADEKPLAPRHVVDVHVDVAPVFDLEHTRIWSCCAGGAVQGAGLLAVAVSLVPRLSLEGDVGFELSDGTIYGGMLRSPLTSDGLPRLEVSGAIGSFVIKGSSQTLYLVHAELAAQVHPISHVLLFFAVGPDVSLSRQNDQGDTGEHGWKRYETAVRVRIGAGGRW